MPKRIKPGKSVNSGVNKVESIEEFYKNKFGWMPENVRSGLGHFNVFKLEPFVGENAEPSPYRRRDYFKIMLVLGSGRVQYADKTIEVKKQALSFSNPQIPYMWDRKNEIQGGVFCIFNTHFFHKYGDLNSYSLFQPNGTHVFELTDEQVQQVEVLFQRMFEEIKSHYEHKYDMLRTLVFELIHFAMKMQPAVKLEKHPGNASQRLTSFFLELMERQFPIDENHRVLSLRSPSAFAQQLNIHVNHLNRAVKETTDKTTSQIIADRILQEAKVLLRHSNFTVSEIASKLGFEEPTHFSNFFKKHAQISPTEFRNV